MGQSTSGGEDDIRRPGSGTGTHPCIMKDFQKEEKPLHSLNCSVTLGQLNSESSLGDEGGGTHHKGLLGVGEGWQLGRGDRKRRLNPNPSPTLQPSRSCTFLGLPDPSFQLRLLSLSWNPDIILPISSWYVN